MFLFIWQDLSSLLIGVKSSEELSKMASKIFSMKHQIQELKKFNIPCVESVIREKLESKSGLLHFKLKKNMTVPSSASNRNSTASPTKNLLRKQKPLREEDDGSEYSRVGARKKHENLRPSAKPQVTQVIQNIILHHDDNKFMKSVDVTGATKSNIANSNEDDSFVVNQPVPQNMNMYPQQNGNLQNSYGYTNPYNNMYWKKKA